jgi:hypothetical protein
MCMTNPFVFFSFLILGIVIVVACSVFPFSKKDFKCLIYSSSGRIRYSWSEGPLFSGTTFFDEENKSYWDCRRTRHHLCSCTFWCVCCF